MRIVVITARNIFFLFLFRVVFFSALRQFSSCVGKSPTQSETNIGFIKFSCAQRAAEFSSKLFRCGAALARRRETVKLQSKGSWACESLFFQRFVGTSTESCINTMTVQQPETLPERKLNAHRLIVRLYGVNMFVVTTCMPWFLFYAFHDPLGSACNDPIRRHIVPHDKCDFMLDSCWVFPDTSFLFYSFNVIFYLIPIPLFCTFHLPGVIIIWVKRWNAFTLKTWQFT